LDLRGRKWLEAEENYVMRSFNNLYFSSNIIRVIKSRSIRWKAHVARIEEMKMLI